MMLVGPTRLAARALMLLLTIDMFVRPPYGLYPLRFIFTGARHMQYPPTTCGWDYEAEWRVAFVTGDSPLTLEMNPNKTDGKPRTVLTCVDVISAHTSFIADPFFITDKESGTPNNDWYLFFERKSLDRRIGEIGVMMSEDPNHETWSDMGAVLSEPFHLSYPFVWRGGAADNGDDDDHFYMIPETNEALEVRIYSAKRHKFPFGWNSFVTKLAGSRFVDTSIVFYQNRWWIFTTVEYSLYVYSTEGSVVKDEWVPHANNPVVVSDRQYGRSGGHPVIHNGKLYRYAQDCRKGYSYGHQLYVFEITDLTPDSYQEVLASDYAPTGNYGKDWNGARTHHVDAHHIGDGKWMAAVDGDPNPEDTAFYKREGWFYKGKRIILVLLIVFEIVYNEGLRSRIASRLPFLRR